ncbi:hypothetical protein TELCIR_05576, partial [Teladorsagia circumcincta]
MVEELNIVPSRQMPSASEKAMELGENEDPTVQIWSLNYVTEAEIIKVGLLFVNNVTELEPAIGYRTSASAVLIAEDRIKKEQLLPAYDYQFSILFDECNEQLAAGGTFKLIKEHQVNVIIGPTCSDPTITSAIISAYYNVPILTWGLSTSSVIDNVNRFPTTGVLSVNSFSLGIAVRSILLAFQWDQFALLYSNVGDYDSSCKAMKNDLQNVVNRFDDLTINFVTDVMEMTLDYVKKVMHYTAERARNVRNADGQEHYVWQDLKNTKDGRDEEAKEAFTYHRGAAGNKEKYNQFGEEVIKRMKDPPFSCTTQCSGKEYQR